MEITRKIHNNFILKSKAFALEKGGPQFHAILFLNLKYLMEYEIIHLESI